MGELFIVENADAPFRKASSLSGGLFSVPSVRKTHQPMNVRHASLPRQCCGGGLRSHTPVSVGAKGRCANFANPTRTVNVIPRLTCSRSRSCSARWGFFIVPSLEVSVVMSRWVSGDVRSYVFHVSSSASSAPSVRGCYAETSPSDWSLIQNEGHGTRRRPSSPLRRRRRGGEAPYHIR